MSPDLKQGCYTLPEITNPHWSARAQEWAAALKLPRPDCFMSTTEMLAEQRYRYVLPLDEGLYLDLEFKPWQQRTKSISAPIATADGVVVSLDFPLAAEVERLKFRHSLDISISGADLKQRAPVFSCETAECYQPAKIVELCRSFFAGSFPKTSQDLEDRKAASQTKLRAAELFKHSGLALLNKNPLAKEFQWQLWRHLGFPVPTMDMDGSDFSTDDAPQWRLIDTTEYDQVLERTFNSIFGESANNPRPLKLIKEPFILATLPAGMQAELLRLRPPSKPSPRS